MNATSQMLLSVKVFKGDEVCRPTWSAVLTVWKSMYCDRFPDDVEHTLIVVCKHVD